MWEPLAYRAGGGADGEVQSTAVSTPSSSSSHELPSRLNEACIAAAVLQNLAALLSSSRRCAKVLGLVQCCAARYP